jgi:hypothetical protein
MLELKPTDHTVNYDTQKSVYKYIENNCNLSNLNEEEQRIVKTIIKEIKGDSNEN